MSRMQDTHARVHTDEDGMRERILSFIFPNVPRTPDEEEAVEKAVAFQIDHEKGIMDSMDIEDVNLPNGVQSFSVGNFSMSFANDGYRNGAILTKETICPVAYGVLLRAGLLYRGVGTAGGCKTCL